MAVISSLEDVERLVRIVVDNKLDFIEVEGVRVGKSRHETVARAQASNPQSSDTDALPEDEYGVVPDFLKG